MHCTYENFVWNLPIRHQNAQSELKSENCRQNIRISIVHHHQMVNGTDGTQRNAHIYLVF